MGSENGQANGRIDDDLIANILTSRQEWFRKFMDPRRDMEHECGWPVSGYDAVGLQRLYDREAVAGRVVDLYPLESWKSTPTVFEDDGNDVSTDFEDGWDALARSLRGEQSWYRDEAGSPVWEYLRRVDVLSGIGRFGVLLLGLDDGRPLSEPAEGVEEAYSMPSEQSTGGGRPSGVYNLTVNAEQVRGRRLIYLRVYPESLIQVNRWESNRTSPRFGLPVSYLLTFADGRDQSGTGAGTGTFEAHWTRVLHVADTLRASDAFAAPRMEPVLNRILDLRKVLGADAEGFYRGCFMGLVLSTHPSLGGDVRINKQAMRDDVEHFQHGFQRYLALQGMDAHGLPPQVVDPTPHVDAQIEAICIRLAVPKRVFCGSERGELASSQDADSWENRLRERRNNYLTPRLIVPFVDRLILLGVLPRPAGYSVAWPEGDRQTPLEKADVLLKRTQALVAYTAGQPGQGLTLLDWLVNEYGYTEEQAEATLRAVMEDQGAAEDDAEADGVGDPDLIEP